MHSLKRTHSAELRADELKLAAEESVSKESRTAGAPDRFLRMPDVLARTGFSRSTLYRQLAAGTFPKQVRISQRCIGWSEAAVNAWLRDLAQYVATP